MTTKNALSSYVALAVSVLDSTDLKFHISRGSECDMRQLPRISSEVGKERHTAQCSDSGYRAAWRKNASWSWRMQTPLYIYVLLMEQEMMVKSE